MGGSGGARFSCSTDDVLAEWLSRARLPAALDGSDDGVCRPRVLARLTARSLACAGRRSADQNKLKEARRASAVEANARKKEAKRTDVDAHMSPLKQRQKAYRDAGRVAVAAGADDEAGPSERVECSQKPVGGRVWLGVLLARGDWVDGCVLLPACCCFFAHFQQLIVCRPSDRRRLPWSATMLTLVLGPPGCIRLIHETILHS